MPAVIPLTLKSCTTTSSTHNAFSSNYVVRTGLITLNKCFPITQFIDSMPDRRERELFSTGIPAGERRGLMSSMLMGSVRKFYWQSLHSIPELSRPDSSTLHQFLLVGGRPLLLCGLRARGNLTATSKALPTQSHPRR